MFKNILFETDRIFCNINIFVFSLGPLHISYEVSWGQVDIFNSLKNVVLFFLSVRSRCGVLLPSSKIIIILNKCFTV